MPLHLEALTPAARGLAPRLFPHIADAGFIMAGGTALALQIGHRVSVDFDFFCAPDRFPPWLAQRIVQEFPQSQVLQDKAGTLDVLVEGAKCSFFAYPYRFSPSVESYTGIPLATVLDIGGMKVIAISQRGAKKDFADLYEVLRRNDFADVARNMRERYGSALLNAIHIGKSLVYFDDADKDPEPVYIGAECVWVEIKEYFRQHTREHTQCMMETFGA